MPASTPKFLPKLKGQPFIGHLLNFPRDPFEGDGTTVAMNGNFTLTNAKGQLVPFMDDCHRHPAPHPREQYLHLLNVATVPATIRCLHGQLDAPLATYQG